MANAQETALDTAAAAFEAQTTRFTELAGLLRGLVLNNVLLCELIILDAYGSAERTVSTPYASVGACHYDSTHPLSLTVTSSPRAAVTPAAGIGVLRVAPGCVWVWPLTGTVVTVYGSPGTPVLLTLWETPQCPMAAANVWAS